MTTYGSSTATYVNGITVSSGSSPAPTPTPKGLIVTRAVETKAGWVGQMLLAEEIVWESKPANSATTAERWATERVVKKMKKVFA